MEVEQIGGQDFLQKIFFFLLKCFDLIKIPKLCFLFVSWCLKFQLLYVLLMTVENMDDLTAPEK